MNDLWICPNHGECKDTEKQKAAMSIPHGRCEPHNRNEWCAHNNFRGFCPPCIPYGVRELQVGDRVRVLGKTVDESTNIHNVPLEKTGIEKGGIYTVGAVRSCEGKVLISLKEDMGRDFAPQDFEYIGGKDMEKPKYKCTVKPRSIAEIYRDVVATRCREAFDQFTNFLWHFKPTNVTEGVPEEEFLAWATAQQDTKSFGIDKGFIEEVQNEYDKWVDELKQRLGVPYNRNYLDAIIAIAKRMPRD